MSLNITRKRNSAVSNMLSGQEKVSVTIILIISFVLRLLAMGWRDLDLDEVFSYFLAYEHSFLDLVSPFSPVITGDAHPPLYYFFAHVWVHTGYPLIELFTSNPELAFRFPFALIGAVTTFVMYRIGKHLGGQKLGLLLGFLHAINSFAIQISNQARMYPIVELLAALLLYQWMILKPELTLKRGIPFIVLSSMLLLTHYSAFFYVIVIWATFLWAHRHRLKTAASIAFLNVLCLIWWLPGLLIQVGREASANVYRTSSGVIVPFTFFHFFTGERSMSLGAIPQITPHIHAIAIFLISGASLGWLAWKRKSQTLTLNYFVVICTLPVFLNWLATFKIQRVFNATHYAIYSLPPFLLLLAIIIYYESKKNYRIALFAASLMILINLTTVFRFFNNTLVPYEPWNEVCQVLDSHAPQKIYIYPSYMSVLFKFYGPQLPVEGLPYKCNSGSASNLRAEILNRGKSGNIFLVVSHDKGEGDCYRSRFKKVFGQKQFQFSYHNIQISLFNYFQ